MELGAFLNTTLLKQDTLRTVILEDIRIEGHGLLPRVLGTLVVFPRKVSHTEVAPDGSGLGIDAQRLLVLTDGAPITLAGVISRSMIVDRVVVWWSKRACGLAV